jgi:hypothetical protein
MALDPAEQAETLLLAARLAGVTLQPDDIKIELLPAPHTKPSSLPQGCKLCTHFFSIHIVQKLERLARKRRLALRASTMV